MLLRFVDTLESLLLLLLDGCLRRFSNALRTKGPCNSSSTAMDKAKIQLANNYVAGATKGFEVATAEWY